jgi:hypothetical protein
MRVRVPLLAPYDKPEIVPVFSVFIAGIRVIFIVKYVLIIFDDDTKILSFNL